MGSPIPSDISDVMTLNCSPSVVAGDMSPCIQSSRAETPSLLATETSPCGISFLNSADGPIVVPSASRSSQHAFARERYLLKLKELAGKVADLSKDMKQLEIADRERFGGSSRQGVTV